MATRLSGFTMHQQYNRAICWISGIALLSLLPLIAPADELNSREQAAASQVANSIPWASLTRSKAASHPLGTQTLSVEADWQKNANGQRIARAYQFDHDQRQSRLLMIDLDTMQLIKQHRIDSVHLPLNNNETQYARQLLDQHSEMLGAINQERAKQSQTAVGDFSDYDAKASIYEPLIKTHPCQTARCVLFALVDTSLTVSSVEPLVNLSTGEIALLQSTLP